jgi:hypothetical protein
LRRSLELWNNGSLASGNAFAAGTFRVTVTRPMKAVANSVCTGRSPVTQRLLLKAD